MTIKQYPNWTNFGISLMAVLLYLASLYYMAVFFQNITGSSESIYGLMNILNAFASAIFSFYALEKETNKYENCAPAGGIFIGMNIPVFRLFAILVIFYQFLQIKDGLAIPKTKEDIAKNNIIMTIFGMGFLLMIATWMIFGLLTLAIHPEKTWKQINAVHEMQEEAIEKNNDAS